VLRPVSGSRFKRDVKRMQRRGKDLSKLRQVIRMLLEEVVLPLSCKDHLLTGNWKSFRDCHLEPDWLLLYKIDRTDLILTRTGTHSDLFDS
jgi:mRNA interferase YafQ